MPNSRSSHIPSNLSHGVLRNTVERTVRTRKDDAARRVLGNRNRGIGDCIAVGGGDRKIALGGGRKVAVPNRKRRRRPNRRRADRKNYRPDFTK